jgi:hypothetical protein
VALHFRPRAVASCIRGRADTGIKSQERPLDGATDLPHDDGMAAVQWVALLLTAMAAGLASYLYNDGRDDHIRLVLQAGVATGMVGTALFLGSTRVLRTLEPAGQGWRAALRSRPQ